VRELSWPFQSPYQTLAHSALSRLSEAEAEQPQPGPERSEQPSAGKIEAPEAEARRQNGKQDTKPDRRGFEERSVDELRDRARELEIEGRASMSKDELIAALRQHAK
jgi:Rho termination factor, N-terminal domain